MSGSRRTKSAIESRNAGWALARSMSVRSMISTADGLRAMMCCVASAAARNVGK